MDVRLFILVLLCLAFQGAASQASPAGKGELVQPVQVKSMCVACRHINIHNSTLPFHSSCKLHKNLPCGCGEQNRWNQRFYFLTKWGSWQGNSTAASEPKNQNQNSIWPLLVARMWSRLFSLQKINGGLFITKPDCHSAYCICSPCKWHPPFRAEIQWYKPPLQSPLHSPNHN